MEHTSNDLNNAFHGRTLREQLKGTAMTIVSNNLPHGRNKIDLSDDIVARHWAKKLGKTKEEIAAAIEKVGNNCATVRKGLGCPEEG